MITTYKNNRNPHKFIDVKHTADRHYMWRQRMVFSNGVENPVGTPKGGFRRQSKVTIDEVLNDYTPVNRYYYRFDEVPDHFPWQYLTNEQIASIPIYLATPELDRESFTDPNTDLWAINDPVGYSCVPGWYSSEEEARNDLGGGINLSVFEYIHDI